MDIAVVLVVSLGAMVAYTVGLGRARRAPGLAAQSSYMAGVTLAAVGLAMPDSLFSLHVAGHLLLAVAGPLLIVLGRPLDVACDASVRVRLRVADLRRGRWARAVTRPAVVWLLFNGGLLALYLTPLYQLSQQHRLVHELVHVHMLAAGLLFAELALGTSLPSRPSAPARVAAIGFSIPVHGLLGLVVLSFTEPVLQPPSLQGAGGLADQRTGGWLLWVAGDLVLSAVLVAAVLTWAADDARRERVADRVYGR